ncbi:kinase-like domain-containing protein [Suillus americanus]|nr:kinase-like domain-containing protein [Suillus americanus]
MRSHHPTRRSTISVQDIHNSCLRPQGLPLFPYVLALTASWSSSEDALVDVIHFIVHIRLKSYRKPFTSGFYLTMCNSVKSDCVVAFKLEPNIISATAIRRLEQFPTASGWLGDVWKCSMSTQSEARLVAVKSVRIPTGADGELIQKTGNRIRRETYVWIRLSHDNILPLEGVTEGFGPLPAFVAPWMENGTLNDYLRREVGLSREKKLTMVREVAAGLQYLHDKDIVHGDMTDTNILVSNDGRLYLADFALSMILAESNSTTFSSCHGGNSRWMPPEAMMPLGGMEQPEGKPTKAGDVYAYGCIMMRVFFGRQPYHRMKGAIAIMGAVLRGTEPFSQLTCIDEEIQRFARQCLLRDSERRPSIACIVEFLWSQANIAETTLKMMLSELPVKQILKEVLRKCDCRANDLEVLGATLKCMWVHESSETEVSAFILIQEFGGNASVNRSRSRL